jgi:undecaprenyl diphosphate synthase
MDGNGRWAKGKNRPRVFGHKNGVKSVREVTEAAAELGVRYLTLYAFSTENWNRPKIEVEALMILLVDTIRNEIKTLNENNIRLLTIGNPDALPASTRKELDKGIRATADNDGLQLILALNYSSREEIQNAFCRMLADYDAGLLNSGNLNDNTIRNYLYTSAIPDPDLLIRTSGEYRISNFLLWQIAYTEMYFTETLWPDFHKESFYKAILDFQQRERRFGKTSEQIISPI